MHFQEITYKVHVFTDIVKYRNEEKTHNCIHLTSYVASN